MDNLVCGPCREAKPFLLSCIHTFKPLVRRSGVGEYDREEAYRAEQEIGGWRGNLHAKADGP